MGRHYFIRQLRDIKISIRVETFRRAEMDICADWCGRALALSHARSGHSAVLSGYMGKSDAFERAMTGFSVAMRTRTRDTTPPSVERFARAR